jgi:hypothetical protein
VADDPSLSDSVREAAREAWALAKAAKAAKAE